MVLVISLFTCAVLSAFGFEGLADIAASSKGALTAHSNPAEKKRQGQVAPTVILNCPVASTGSMSASTADTPDVTPVSAAGGSTPSRTESPFLLPLAQREVAAQHNTIAKLHVLLDHPENALPIRSELIPDGLRLEDLFHIVSWTPNRLWRALGFGGHAKYTTVYKWVRLLAPCAGLPHASEITEKEMNLWFKRLYYAYGDSSKVDDDEVPQGLQLAQYDGEDEGCWLLLQPAAVVADA